MSNDHDPFDHDLAAALRRRAGASVAPVDAAHDAVLRRATGIRRRRAAVAGGGLLAVAVLAIALMPRGGGSETVAPADSPDVEISEISEISGDDAGSSSTSSTSSTRSPGSSTSVSPTTVDLSVPTVAPVTAPTSSEPPGTSRPDGGEATTTAPRNSSSTSSTSPNSSTSSTSTTLADPNPTAFTRTYQSAGGSITVSFDGERLSLDSVAAAAGHEADIQDDTADRVRVRFNGPNESRIEIRVENGEIRERIDG